MTIRNLEAYLKPRRVLLLGEPLGSTAQELIANLRQAAPPGLLVESTRELEGGEPGVLGIVGDPATLDEAMLAQLAARGCRALIWPHDTRPDTALLQAARAHTTRLLGPRSPGILNPAARLNATVLPAALLPGTMALIVQSQSVASAAIDWATGRRFGFSWVAITGGESDVDIADLLDYAALDPHTRAVALEVGRIRGARKFMSAARACARAKPVVVLQTRQADWHGKGSDPVRSAAFARAGMVECLSLPGLFDAFAALYRLPPLQHGRVLVVSNGSGICALGVDAVLRTGLQAAEPDEATWTRVRALVPELKRLGGGADLGEPAMDTVIAALREFLRDKAVDVVLFVRSPGAGRSHTAVAAELVKAGFDERLLTVWLGLETALPARKLSAEANLATFISADAAARAVRYRWEYARNRELLTQTPPRGPTAPTDAADIARRLRRMLDAGTTELRGKDAARLLAAYGLDSHNPRPRRDLRLDVRVARHAELGMHLGISLVTPGFSAPAGYGFMPLDPLLARRILADAGLHADAEAAAGDLEALAQALVRIGQFALDQPLLAELRLRLSAHGGIAQCIQADTHLQLAAATGAERARLALAPYPAALSHILVRGTERYRVRPVRPDDEPALIRLLEGLDPETVRLRFFAYIRHFSHDLAARMTQIDYDRELALVITPEKGAENLIGMGTLSADPDGARAEFAVLVDKEHCGLGLGRHLLEQFLQHARQQGIGTVFGEVLAENSTMLGLARSLGFSTHAIPDDPGCMHVEIAIQGAA
ncbi:bifunctional acetate--CoA ligase family protein/GNAT family N-acetyltransferase [Nevskia soli]|uniref:bifunctional acetate--CoA ligase family protein/GNAT family N-acetyltransferase n=1 Tax=Nevskia soli TaxID=418856 RepID=UPI0004A6FBB4|nr:GNAT family N-acetyltransferase [Nevskia soli]